MLRAVQEKARDEAETPAWRKWLRPRTVRVRLTPATALVAVTAVVLAGLWMSRRGLSSFVEPEPNVATAATEAPERAAADEDDSVGEAVVRLVVPASGAHTVAVAGDFNEWRTDDTFLEDPEGDGVFVGTLRLQPGSYGYMFVIDGERWVTDPYAANHRDDGFGNENAVLRID